MIDPKKIEDALAKSFDRELTYMFEEGVLSEQMQEMIERAVQQGLNSKRITSFIAKAVEEAISGDEKAMSNLVKQAIYKARCFGNKN